jgi:coenzyme F420-reducing hydrogenase beta subunit
MVEDAEGFLYPSIARDGCNNCDLCRSVCPVLNPPSHVGVLDDPITIAAYNDDETIRKQSSSGGVFSALAREIINRGGKVYGAGFDSAFALRHMGVDNLQDLHKLRGSKYLQSRMGTAYQDIRAELRVNKEILFVGTPCQIAGLNAFLGRTYDNLLTCDLVCHGVPSPKVFTYYLKYLRRKYRAGIRSISFRDKRIGWNSYSITVAFVNGKVYSQPFTRDVFMRGFLHNLYLRLSCYECPFVGFPRWGDITLADYWGVEGKHPDFGDDKGTSLLFVNTGQGRDFFDEIKDQLTYMPSTGEYAVAHNPSITGSYSVPARRAAFFKDLQRLPFGSIMYKYALVPIPRCILRVGMAVKRFVAFVLLRRGATSNA